MDRFRDQDYLAQLDAIVPGWRDRDASARDGTAPAPRLRHVVVFPTGGDAPGGVLTLEALQARGEQVSTDDVTRRQRESAYPDEVADILYTSGTTSLPKGVMLTHDMLWRSALSTAYARGYEDGRRIFFPMPLYHVFGYVEGLLAAILVGGAIVPQLIFDPTAALRLIADKRVSEALFVPSALVALLHAETLEQFDLSALRSVFCASAPAPVWLWEQVQRDLGLEEVHTGYGMTEVSAATVATRQGDSIETVASTVGRVMPGGPGGLDEFGGANTQYKVIDPISGEDLADGAEGELVCRGNIVTRGYYRKPIETAEAIDGDGWLRSGDLGRIRPDGSIELTGRSKDIYIVNGENVTPKESEECLGRHPAVEQAFVVGVPDERRGEVGVAWVVRKAGADPSPEELLDHVREHLARHKVPAHVLFIDVADLPTTASGKIQKFRLRERAIVDLALGTVQDTMSVPRRAAEPG